MQDNDTLMLRVSKYTRTTLVADEKLNKANNPIVLCNRFDIFSSLDVLGKSTFISRYINHYYAPKIGNFCYRCGSCCSPSRPERDLFVGVEIGHDIGVVVAHEVHNFRP